MFTRALGSPAPPLLSFLLYVDLSSPGLVVSCFRLFFVFAFVRVEPTHLSKQHQSQLRRCFGPHYLHYGLLLLRFSIHLSLLSSLSLFCIWSGQRSPRSDSLWPDLSRPRRVGRQLALHQLRKPACVVHLFSDGLSARSQIRHLRRRFHRSSQ
jgi:hypothetical protein